MSEMTPDEALAQALEGVSEYLPSHQWHDEEPYVRKAILRVVLAELQAVWGNSSTADPFKGIRTRHAAIVQELGDD